MKVQKFQSPQNAPATEYEKDLERSLDKFTTSVGELLNNGLKFDDNFDAYIGNITTDATPGNDTAIAHGLKRVPSGYLIIKRDKAGIIYDGAAAWTETNIYVRSNLATVAAKIIVF